MEIEILIGADYVCQFEDGCVTRGESNEPVAKETSMSWVLSTPLKCRLCETAVKRAKANLLSVSIGQCKEAEVQHLWDSETLGIRLESDVLVNIHDAICASGVKYSVRLALKVGSDL